MENIQEHFGTKIFINRNRQYSVSRQTGVIHITGLYKSDVIYDIERHGITDANDLRRKIKPFI